MTLIQLLEQSIQRLEKTQGANDPVLLARKAQLAALKETQGQTAQQIYLMGGRRHSR
jgi:hypothetical protein